MRTSAYGLQLIKDKEGFRSRIYADIVGHLTIGYGHLILPTDTYNNDTVLTEEEGTQVLLKDLAHVELYLNAASPGLYQNEFDALADFGFNLGTHALHELLSHGLGQVPTQILLWDHAAGKVVTGLLDRRKAELDLWNKDDHDGV